MRYDREEALNGLDTTFILTLPLETISDGEILPGGAWIKVTFEVNEQNKKKKKFMKEHEIHIPN